MSEFDLYKGKRVLITGNTGFKGSWLAAWLNSLGAEVYGYSLYPSALPDYESLGISDCLRGHKINDVCDFSLIKATIEECAPDFIFHLAAQALVGLSYKDPTLTWNVNVIGTVNLLEAVRSIGRECVIVLVTSDKVYENHEWVWAYRENDQLGGRDPYSASKAGAELAIASMVKSFFNDEENIKVGVGRAGNVIGGGDWSHGRIVPDCIRAWLDGAPVTLRQPHSTRPWQHVLEPLSGYLTLGRDLYFGKVKNGEQFNFGPEQNLVKTVEELVMEMATHWEGAVFEIDAGATSFHEAELLALNVDKARNRLKWRPRWSFQETVMQTMQWYDSFFRGGLVGKRELMTTQIQYYEKANDLAR